jgi:hypothetical protein
VFANQGHRIEPYLIEKITDGDGNVLFAAQNAAEVTRVISERNAFVMNSLLQSVVDEGTGTGVKRYLRRDDVAGKTGTTNDSVDGWFAGYAGDVVTVTWMGFDDNRSLGRHEFGATTALPIWAAYMEGRLAGAPEASFPTPPQLARLNDDWAYAENADGSHGIASIGFPPPTVTPDVPADGNPPGAPTAAAPTPAALEVSPQVSSNVLPLPACDHGRHARLRDTADLERRGTIHGGRAVPALSPARAVLGNGWRAGAMRGRTAAMARRPRSRGTRQRRLSVPGRDDPDLGTRPQDRSVRSCGCAGRARRAGSARTLFALVYGFGIAVTAFMSNDATAVVLTPAVIAATRAARVKHPLPYLYACAFIANAASFLLPISNPANLVLFGDRMPPLTSWLARFTLPSVVAIAMTFIVLYWTQRDALAEPIANDVPTPL